MPTKQALMKREIKLQQALEAAERKKQEDAAYRLIASRISLDSKQKVDPSEGAWRNSPGRVQEAHALLEAVELYPMAAAMIERRAKTALSEKNYPKNSGLPTPHNWRKTTLPLMPPTERQEARTVIKNAAAVLRQRAEQSWLEAAAEKRLDPTGRYRQRALLEHRRKVRHLTAPARIAIKKQKVPKYLSLNKHIGKAGAYPLSSRSRWDKNTLSISRAASLARANQKGVETRLAAKRAIRSNPGSQKPGLSEEFLEQARVRAQRINDDVRARKEQSLRGQESFAIWSKNILAKTRKTKEEIARNERAAAIARAVKLGGETRLAAKRATIDRRQKKESDLKKYHKKIEKQKKRDTKKFEYHGERQSAKVKIGAFGPQREFKWRQTAALKGAAIANEKAIKTVRANRLGFETKMAAKSAASKLRGKRAPGSSQKFQELSVKHLRHQKPTPANDKSGFKAWSRHQDQKRMSVKELSAIREASEKMKVNRAQKINKQNRPDDQRQSSKAEQANGGGAVKRNVGKTAQPKPVVKSGEKPQLLTTHKTNNAKPPRSAAEPGLKNALAQKWQQAKGVARRWGEKVLNRPQAKAAPAIKAAPLKNSPPKNQRAVRPAQATVKSPQPQAQKGKPAKAPTPKPQEKNYANAKKTGDRVLRKPATGEVKHQKKDVPSRSLGKDASRASNLAAKVKTAKPAVPAQKKKAVAQM